MSAFTRRNGPTLLSCVLVFLTCALGLASAEEPGGVMRLQWTGRCVGCDLSSADLAGANLEGADLSQAVLDSAYMYRVDLKDADLSRAVLDSAYMFRANLQGADLRGANLNGTNLSAANLKGSRGADLRSAHTDALTICPEGQPGPCGVISPGVKKGRQRGRK